MRRGGGGAAAEAVAAAAGGASAEAEAEAFLTELLEEEKRKQQQKQQKQQEQQQGPEGGTRRRKKKRPREQSQARQEPQAEPQEEAQPQRQQEDHVLCVLPGDDVTDWVVQRAGVDVLLGPGLRMRQGVPHVRATQAGLLRFQPPRHCWVQYNTRTYVPQVQDFVVGVVEDRAGDYMRVDIGSGTLALLPALAFEGATKRNRPNLKRGDLLYARVSFSRPDVDTELSCIAISGERKDWVTGLSTFGVLHDGCTARVSTGMARRLLDPDCPLLAALGEHLAFEIAIGLNGLLWVNGKTRPQLIVICNAIRAGEELDDADCRAYVRTALRGLSSSGGRS